MPNFSAGGLLIGFTSALMNQVLCLLHFGVYQAYVFQILVWKLPRFRAWIHFPVKCGFSFQDNRYPKQYCTQCTVRNNYFCRFRVQPWFWKGSYASVQKWRCILELWSRLHAFLSLNWRGWLPLHLCRKSCLLQLSVSQSWRDRRRKFGLFCGEVWFWGVCYIFYVQWQTMLRWWDRTYFSYRIFRNADHKHFESSTLQSIEQRPFLICF